MYKPIRLGKNVIIATSIILAAILIPIYANYGYTANAVKEPDKKFKSEEELIDETRQAIEAHLNDTEEVRVEAKKKTEEKPAEPEAPPTIKEEPKEENPVALKENSQNVQQENQYTPQENSATTAEKPVTEEQSQTAMPSDVQRVTMVKDNEGNLQPVGTEIDYSAKGKGIYLKPAIEQPILRKMDISRIGATPYYETYEGLRLLKYFTVAQRVEIYQEPRPIDSYILDANSMRYIYPNTPWNLKSDFRTQLVPIFTRAYGTEFTMSDPKNKEGQIRYTHDYREIYKNYFPKYQYTAGNVDNFLKEEIWDQNEILLMHAKNIEPIGWLYTSNLGYRYSTMSAKDGDPLNSYYEIRHTYFSSLSLAPTDKIEYFLQGEYYKSMHVKSSFSYRPDHFLGRTEIRIKSNDYKTTFVPQFSYSKDLYYPFADSYEKYEIALRAGRDWTKRFSSTHTVQYVYSFRDEPDNSGPTYVFVGANPHKDKAEYISLENRFSYNVYDRLYLQAGLDIANGINWSIFDNFGLLGGLEYYAPGIIRVDVGWRGNYYYKLEDFMSSIYFKFYLFM